MTDKMMRISGRGRDGKAKAIQTNDDGVLQVQSVGFFNNPLTDTKKIPSTPKEVFAGGSPKLMRRKLIIKNEDSILRIRVGENKDGLQQKGFPVEPGASVEFEFGLSTNSKIYAVSEGAAVNVAVMEV